MHRLLAPVLLTSAILATLAACNGKPSAGVGSAPKISVVATTCLVKDLVQNIGGDRVEVQSIVPCDIDPRMYTPEPRDSQKIAQAQMVFHNGLNWEGGLQKILKGQSDADRRVFSVSSGAPIDRLGAIPGELGAYDPHIWFNVTLWKYATESVRTRLSDSDPSSKAAYERRATAYMHELDTLDEYIRQHVRFVPAEQRVLVSTHTALSYFAKDYRLEFRQVPFEKMDQAQLDTLADLIVQRKIPSIFIDKDHPREGVLQLVQAVEARGGKVAVNAEIVFDVLGEPGTPAGDYVGIMKHNVDVIVEGLRSTPAKS